MATYRFPQFNVDIVDPEVIKEGFAGGYFVNNESQGSFSVQINLETDTAKFGVELTDETQPVNFSVEEIDIWISTQLNKYII